MLQRSTKGYNPVMANELIVIPTLIDVTVEPKIDVETNYVIMEGDAAKVKGAVLKEWSGLKKGLTYCRD